MSRNALTTILSGVAVLLPVLLAACAPAARAQHAELYTGFVLVDPEAGIEMPDSWLIVRNGLIAEIGTGAAPAGDFAVERDVSGLYALPGLIDSHAHLVGGPQRLTFGDDGAAKLEITTGDDYSRSNAAIALAFGITSARNPGGSAEAAARYDAMIGSGAWPGPETRHAGDILQPPTLMAGESFAYPRTAEEWDMEAARQAALGMTYFKLYTDLTEDELAEAVLAAKAHGLIPIAHLNGVSWTRAAELGVRQLEHSLPTSPDLLEPEARGQYAGGADFMTQWWELVDLDGPLMRSMIGALIEHDVIVNLTLLVNEMIYFAGDWERVFPEMAGDVPDYLHPDLVAALEPAYAAFAAVPPEQLARGHAVWPKVLEFARVLHEAGVKMTIGTDGTGGGPIYARELHNHVLAGIPAWDVLRMATSGNAELLGLGNTGRVAEGYEADLIFLRADPVADVRNLREVALVVADGQVWEPEALLEIARGIAMEARVRAGDTGN